METGQKQVTKETIKGFAKMTLDFSFKRVFGNETDKSALKAFIERMIGDVQLSDVTLLPTERLGLTCIDRKTVFDVSCRTNDGTEFIVEMQCAKQKYFRDRALYYAGHPVVEQGKKALEKFVSANNGDTDKKEFRWDFNLKPVIFIAILNYVMEHNETWPQDRYHSSYRIREDTFHEPMNDKLRFIFLELGRFDKDLNELHDINDKWMYALKHMHEFHSRPEELNENEFDSLFNLAKIANFAPDEMNSYLDELVMDNDYWNTIDYAKEEAMKEGHEEGWKKGQEEGWKKGREETIRKLLAAGIDKKMLAEALDIDPEDL